MGYQGVRRPSETLNENVTDGVERSKYLYDHDSCWVLKFTMYKFFVNLLCRNMSELAR